MPRYLFIVRNPNGKDIHAQECAIENNLISMAQALMDVVRGEYPSEIIECCEIWCRTEHHAMILLVTAF